jgi:hypothetical protein
MKSAAVRQALRETMALLSIAFILWGFVASYTLLMRQIVCPENALNEGENAIYFDNVCGIIHHLIGLGGTNRG